MKAVIVLLLLGVVAAQAQDHAINTMKENKADLMNKIVAAAGVDDELSNPKARVTLLAPTDEAILAFLKEMGLTADDVLKNPNLARDIVGYHTILAVTAGPKELFAKGNEVEVPTADPYSKVVFIKKGDSVMVQDEQGNQAKVSKASLGKGAHTVHMIDRVLYSGNYFRDLASLIKMYPKMFSTVAAAATKAGLADRLTKQSFADTVFLPTNNAFERAKVKVADTPKATLEEVLSYHVVPTARRIPDGFESGTKVPTLLKGQDLTVTYKEEGKKYGLTLQRAFVNDNAMVVRPNIVISKGVAHVINSVLTPKAAAAPAVAAEAGKKAGNRKLLQGNVRQQYASTVSLDATEQAILSAVNNDASPEATKRATQVGTVAAVAATPHFGAYTEWTDTR
jgi:uncharacterized surface protein with fasciclin (FAS1) repeats